MMPIGLRTIDRAKVGCKRIHVWKRFVQVFVASSEAVGQKKEAVPARLSCVPAANGPHVEWLGKTFAQVVRASSGSQERELRGVTATPNSCASHNLQLLSATALPCRMTSAP
jgi:hypothetical protein